MSVDLYAGPASAILRARRWSSTGEFMGSMVAGRRIQAWSPLAIMAAAVGAFTWSMTVYGMEAPQSNALSRIYGAMDSFSGAYIPLGSQSAQPSGAMSLAGILSLSVTFAAALSALWALSRRARQWLRARDAGSELIVVGSGQAAAEILRSHPNASRKALLLITGDPDGPAAIAIRDIAPYVVADLESLATDRARLDRARRAEKIAVATDDDALNLAIAHALTDGENSTKVMAVVSRPELADELRPGTKVMAVVSHPELADELRPATIEGELVERFGISCPMENIAEKVCHRLDELLRENQPIKDAGKARLYIDGDGGPLSRSVALWSERLSLSRAHLGAYESALRLPMLYVVDEASSADGPPLIRVMVGADPADTAARTLRAIRSNRDPRPVRYIAVTAEHLLGKHAAPVTVIDPRSAAWDGELVFDDIAEQWGRSYHYAYCVVFADDTEWSTVREGRKGQSSVKAAQEMLRILKEHGYRLVKTDRPVPPQFTSDEVRSMAKREHDDWLKRRYKAEDGLWKPVAEDGNPYKMAWDRLERAQQHRNELLTAQTFPAMAALFGYEIQPSELHDAGG